ncbi:disks large homolog 5-like [Peromyscus maniculatus bairdii]|uniref:disks large homolog 5-like n=1 Tax=Peromyscus maniculatus bairdii TaxID=230844 RepID=UPI001C2E3306|nr:disks large homolog 5-like [Peromyscus maniculatus bairdii]
MVQRMVQGLQGALLTKKQEMQKVESLTTQLQLIIRQRNELRNHFILVTERSLDNRPYHRPNPFYKKLKMEHKQAMSDLKRLENENSEASQKISDVTKEKSFYFDLESRFLMGQSQLKKKVDILRQEDKKLLEDWVLLKQHLGNMKLLIKNQEETSGPQNQQQQHDILTPT